MKHFVLLIIFFLLSSCYVYRPYEAAEDEQIPTIQQQVKKDKMYQLVANGNTYKLQAVKWEGDSLVGYVNRKEDKPIKLHKADITEVKHRQFSRGRSDALTVGIYASIAAIILLLSQ